MAMTVNSFASCFIGANPSGIACGKNDDQFLKVIKEGYAFYTGIGVTAMDIVSTEITALDDFHHMTKVCWRCSFTRKDGYEGKIKFDNIYLTQTVAGQTRIFAYITGDEQASLKENGLI
jgi:hypothetical protein